MSDDATTRLQAMYSGNEILGYICSQLPASGLKTGWIEQGLLAKGLQGSLATKSNQEKFVQPTHEAVHLMADRAVDTPGKDGILILGESGLASPKLAIVLFDDKKSDNRFKKVVSFWTRDYSPQDLIRFIMKNFLDEPLSPDFSEPNLDYIEQMRIDSSDKIASELLCLSIPKEKFNTSLWIKKALNENEDEESSVVFRAGKLKQTPAFALLFSRWLIDLPIYQSLKNGVAAVMMKKKDCVELALWDSPRNLAVFSILSVLDLEGITRKYLVPAWHKKGDRIDPPARTREVIIAESEDATHDEAPPMVLESQMPSTEQAQVNEALATLVEELRFRIDEIPIADILRRLEWIENQAQSLTERVGSVDSGPSPQDINATLGIARTKLNHIVDKLEGLASRLEKIEKRANEVLD